MNVILFDDANRSNLLPFAYTKPVANIRIGILTIKEKWDIVLDTQTSWLTESYLQQQFPCIYAEEQLYINSAITPNASLVAEIKQLKTGEALLFNSVLLACRTSARHQHETEINAGVNHRIESKSAPIHIQQVWDIFVKNGEELKSDFMLLTQGRISAPIPANNQVMNPEQIFLEPGAIVNCSILNASTGPIYIGKDAEVMEGSIIRGPFALCEHSATKLGTKVYGPTTIGPHSKVGGEVNNSVIFGYSNKAHDGFLGNSVIGEWCNLGADTNNSNLKNNYSIVQLYNYTKQSYIDTGLQFCGLIMGDHSKCGINTMFNTGTVVGVGANVFGADFPPKHIPSFSWGGAAGFATFQLEKAKELATKVMDRRGITFSAEDEQMFDYLFEITALQR